MASAAIPVLFPSVHVDEPAEAAGWYVDGATRRRAPLAPALELGADRVVVVGTGGLRPPPDPELDRLAVDLGDAGATCSARSWTTRCDTTCGGSRSSTR
jgi:NTE family protein